MAKVKFLQGTQTNYNGLNTKDDNTLYFITDTNKIYKGNTALASYNPVENGTIAADNRAWYTNHDEHGDKFMTGSYRLADGYCYLTVYTDLVGGWGDIHYSLPVAAIAPAIAIANGGSSKYCCMTNTQGDNNTSVVSIHKLNGGTCNNETISFTLIYKYQ